MRKVLCFGLILMFTLPAFAQHQTEVTDFRDIKWSTHVDSVFRDGEKVNFVKIKNGVEDNAYKIPNDDMTIGSVECDKIQYIFNDNNRFKKVFIQASQEYMPDMQFILSYKFGKADKVQTLGYVNIKTWNLDNVIFNLSKFKNGRDIFTLSIESQWEQSANFKRNTNINDF